MKNKRKIIISPDFDGYLSFFLFKKYLSCDAEILGKYITCKKRNGKEYSLLLFKDLDFNVEETLALDLDINKIDSIGHHYLNHEIVNKYKGKHLNFNLEKKRPFHNKCPFSTVIMLLNLSQQFVIDLQKLFEEKDYHRIAYLLYADNFIKIFKNYQSNVKMWMKEKELEWLYSLILENYEELLKESVKIEEMLINNFKFIRSSFNNYFAQSVSEVNEMVFIKHLCNAFGFEMFDVNYHFKKTFENIRISPDKVNEYNDIFSHAIIDAKTISISVSC